MTHDIAGVRQVSVAPFTVSGFVRRSRALCAIATRLERHGSRHIPLNALGSFLFLVFRRVP